MKPSLTRIRRQLTAWYVGVFIAVMALFGGATYTVVNRQILAGIDQSLERTVDQHTWWVLARQRETALTPEDMKLYERRVAVFDREGRPVWPSEVEPWVQDFARLVLQDSVAKKQIRTPDKRTWLLYGKKIRVRTGRRRYQTYVTVAIADLVTIDDRYPSLFAGYIASAIIAVLLVGIGGAALARKSTQPIEAAMEQMRRFMSDAAHELKTPIAVLRARADVGLQCPRTEAEYREILAGISEEAEHLGGLVEKMLFLARADAGQWPVHRERVFLDDILLDAASAARSLGARKGVEVKVAELEETCVSGDPGLIRQLWLILLDNAVQYTPPGGRVTASAVRRGNRCVVTIADTGIGIPATALPHVFDRFFRADSARGRGGAGLGLAIARWIVDAHGGEIEIDSTEGKGTTVRVSFAAL